MSPFCLYLLNIYILFLIPFSDFIFILAKSSVVLVKSSVILVIRNILIIVFLNKII